MIYISYAKKDSAHANRLYTDLKNAGFDPWIDTKNILPGENWHTAIRNAIKESEYFFALISENSVSQRGYIHKEMKIALDIFSEFAPNAIFIIPVSLDETRAEDETLESLQYVDFQDYANGFDRILNFLKGSSGSQSSDIPPNNSSDPAMPPQKTDIAQVVEQVTPIPQPEPLNWDDIFVGRTSLIEKLTSTKKDAFIFGARRIGKTSLLRHIEKQYSERNIPAFYISLQGVANLDKLKRKLGIAFRRKNLLLMTLCSGNTLFSIFWKNWTSFSPIPSSFWWMKLKRLKNLKQMNRDSWTNSTIWWNLLKTSALSWLPRPISYGSHLEKIAPARHF